MNLNFYQFLRRYANPEDRSPKARLANIAVKDTGFPKHSDNFDEISKYMESHPDYGSLMVVFDDVWQSYQLEKI